MAAPRGRHKDAQSAARALHCRRAQQRLASLAPAQTHACPRASSSPAWPRPRRRRRRRRRSFRCQLGWAFPSSAWSCPRAFLRRAFRRACRRWAWRSPAWPSRASRTRLRGGGARGNSGAARSEKRALSACACESCAALRCAALRCAVMLRARAVQRPQRLTLARGLGAAGLGGARRIGRGCWGHGRAVRKRGGGGGGEHKVVSCEGGGARCARLCGRRARGQPWTRRLTLARGLRARRLGRGCASLGAGAGTVGVDALLAASRAGLLRARLGAVRGLAAAGLATAGLARVRRVGRGCKGWGLERMLACRVSWYSTLVMPLQDPGATTHACSTACRR